MKEDNINFSSEINENISYPKMTEKPSVEKNCSSYILQSSRDQNLYKKFELLLAKNKFHLNNCYDKNNAQIFLKEKNQGMAYFDLDDHIEGEGDGEEDRTVIDNGNSSYIQNHINNNIKKNNDNININSNNQVKNVNRNLQVNKNGKIITKNENNKVSQNQSFEGGTIGCPPGSLFDTGKADLLCLLLGMSNK